MSHSQGATMPRQVSVQPSITEAPSLVAICQSALGDRKRVGGARFDLDVVNHADPALFIRNTHVVAPGSDILQAETLVMIDRSVGIVLALIRSQLVVPGAARESSVIVTAVRFQNRSRSAAAPDRLVAISARQTAINLISATLQRGT